MFGNQSSIVRNMRLYPLFSMAALCLIFSCKSETNTDVIRLDGTFDDNFLESWEYILLEDDNLDAELGIINYGIQYDDGLFFVHSHFNKNTTIKVFDRSGRYLNNIGRLGRGRNEVLTLEKWILDRDKNEVLIAQSFGHPSTVTIKHYDYAGNYLGQTVTDTLDENCVMMDMSKMTSDGTLIIQDNIIHNNPSHDYFNINKDGSISTPLDLQEYHLNQGFFFDIAEFSMSGAITSDNSGGKQTTVGIFNQYSDTTYVIRKMDNHIYRLYGDKSDCIAKLSFMPDAPEKMKKGIEMEDDEFYSYCLGYFMDMKNYMFIGNYEDNYIFDKESSKIYHIEPDTIYAKFPDHRLASVYGNDIIAFVDVESIQEALERINSKDYDHRYTPEVEAFYRKAKDCKNPPIIIAHYK